MQRFRLVAHGRHTGDARRSGTCGTCLPVAAMRWAFRKSGPHMSPPSNRPPCGSRRRMLWGGPACLARPVGCRLSLQFAPPSVTACSLGARPAPCCSRACNSPRPVSLPCGAAAASSRSCRLCGVDTQIVRRGAQAITACAGDALASRSAAWQCRNICAHPGLADFALVQVSASAGRGQGQGWPECARTSCGRLVHGPYRAAPALPARVRACWHRRRLGGAGPRCCSTPRPVVLQRSGRLGGMSPDCDARQERDGLVRGTVAVLGCGLAAAAARIGDAAEGTNDERKTAGPPPLRP